MPKSHVKEMAYWQRNPVRFAELMIMGLSKDDVLANKLDRRLEKETKQILTAVQDHDYVTVHSGRGCTKTTSLAMLALWWIWTRSDARVMATGPKFDQLKATLWAEIQKWLYRSVALKDQLKWTAERIFHVDESVMSFGQLLTSKEKENIAGIHATHVLWLIDEASNVEEDIIMTIIGGMSDPESKVVMTGNPTRTSGAFFNSFTRDAGKPWHVIHLSSENSERKNPVWFEKMQKWPRESDMYRVNVLGLPPRGNPKSIISYEECVAARERTVERGDFIELGVDPASEGDDLATIAVRVGNKLEEIKRYPKTKANELVEYTIATVREYRRKTGIKSVVRIKIDDTGFGNAVRHFLALDKSNNIEVIPCLFGGKGNDSYHNYATVMWYEMADVINSAELINDDNLIEELSSREWMYVGVSNKMMVEPKSKFKDRHGRSPDLADACIMCFAKGPKRVLTTTGEESNVRDFHIDWERTRIHDIAFDGVIAYEILHIASIVLNNDISVSCLMAVYEKYKDMLWIYDELYHDNPMPDVLAAKIKMKTHKGCFEDERDVRILGNDILFKGKDEKRPLSEVLLRSGLYIVGSDYYDEFGAIALGMRMFRDTKVIIHENVTRAREEINTWVVNKGKIEISGFCKALLLILSEVKKQMKNETVNVMGYRSPYSGVVGDYYPIVEKEQKRGDNAWMMQ